jgi:Carboxypeptidase regulatory-like domain/TonB dependent receptor
MRVNALTLGVRVCASTKSILRLLSAAAVLLLISVPLFSQSNQGVIQGAVLDQTGGAIAGASVTVIDVARGVSRALTTDAAGQYVAPSLLPGTYTVRAEAKGFRITEHSGVLVEVGQTIRVDLTVQPGEQTQTVTVTGEIPEIDTTDSTLGGTVSNAAINALPLNGRNFERLLQLRPGVVTDPGSGAGNASTNGRRTGNDLLLVEGIAQIGPSNGTTTLNSVYRTGDANSLVPIDAIQEFNTQQNYKAEYGWRDGSVINVGVKSGTNSIHGAAYAFGRDASATDAHNFFTPGTATDATVEQFGAVAGGPIIKDKLFWFMGYEGLRTSLTNPALVTIPADVAMPGFVPPAGSTNGCNVLTAGNCAFSIVDACNDLKAAGTPISALSAQLAGLNTATCTVSPASSTVENLFPFTTNTNTAGNFEPALVTTGPLNNGFIKGDYVLGPHHHISGFYFVSKSFQHVGYNNNQLTSDWQANVPSNVQMFNGAWTWTPGSAWVNDVRAGYSYLYAKTLSADVNKIPANPWPTGYGFNTGVTNPLYGGLPEIDIGGITGYLGAGRRTGWRGPEGNASFVDTVSYLRGKHAFKFGFDFVDVVYDNNAYNRANGQIKFNDLPSFLQGSPKSGTILVGDPNLYARAHWYAAFIQDDWRLTTRVTLNLGLRWEYNGSPVEAHNYEGSFNPNVDQTTTFAVQQVGPGAPLTSFYNADHKDFSPRLGVAWDVQGNGKTVVRAGASILRNPVVAGQYIGLSPFGANVPAIGLNTSGQDINLHTPLQLALTGPQLAAGWNTVGPVFPGNASLTTTGAFAGTFTGPTCTYTGELGLPAKYTPTPCTTQAVNPNFRQPYSAQWNLDIQRAITNSLTLDLAYIGVHGVHEATWVDINQPPVGLAWNTPTSALPAALASQALKGGVSPAAYCLQNPAQNCGVVGTRPQKAPINAALVANEEANSPYYSKFPYLNEVVQLGNQDFSNYDGLQVTVNERTSHGLSFLAGYTFAHALDIVSADATDQQPYPIDARNVRLNYGNSDHDIRHRFTFSPSYLIPGRKSPAQMLQGWSVSGIVTLQSGLPWGASDVTDDLIGTGEFVGTISSALQPWNYSGPRSAFKAGPQSIPQLKGSAATATCQSAAEAPYAGNAQQVALADAALADLGCYAQGGGILTPPAFGTIGNAGRNIFRAPSYYNVDMSIGKEWKFKERYSAQFRAEFFNLFNRADFALPGSNSSGLDPGAASQFGCACATADVQGNNPVLGSGGPRHIQFGLKLLF